jgi:hypothetical protein
MYNFITRSAGCANISDTLQCLRQVPSEKMNLIINNTATINGASVRLTGFGPSIDGDFIERNIKQQLSNNKFVHVAIISGGMLQLGQGQSLTSSSSKFR